MEAPRFTPKTEQPPESKVYNREATRKAALETVERELHDRLLRAGAFSEHEQLEKKPDVLAEMLEHYAARHPGTQIPINNEYRHLAEVTAELLKLALAERALEGLLKKLNMAA